MAAQVGNVLLVATAGDEVVGCLQLVLSPGLSPAGTLRAQIEGVRVASAHRGRRIGERLAEDAIERARAAYCGLGQLTSDASRAYAHRLYERLGFVPTHVGMKRSRDRAAPP